MLIRVKPSGICQKIGQRVGKLNKFTLSVPAMKESYIVPNCIIPCLMLKILYSNNDYDIKW